MSLKRNRSVAAEMICAKVMKQKERNNSCLVGTISRQELISLSNVIIIHTEFTIPKLFETGSSFSIKESL